MTPTSTISYRFDALRGLYLSESLAAEPQDGEACFSFDEAELLAILNQAKDLSHGSEELLEEISTPFHRLHLSPERANLLHPVKKLLHGNVLQLTVGGGAIARFLAECGCRVKAVEPNENLATLTRSRCRDIDVSVYVAGPELFPADIDYDVIVVIDSLVPEHISLEDYFRRLKGVLKPNGVLVAGINNKLAMLSLTQSPSEQKGWSATKASIEKILPAVGLPNFKLFFGFPGLEVTRLVVWPELQPPYPEGIEAILAAFDANRPPAGDRFPHKPFWKSILHGDLLPQLSNTFLAVASPAPLPVMHTDELLVIYSSFRRKHFARITKLSREGQDVTVSRIPLFPETPPPPKSPYLTRPHQEPYIEGKQYLSVLQEIVAREGWQVQEVVGWAKPWLDLLKTQASDQTFHEYISGFRRLLLLPTDYLDCIPSNIVVTHDRNLIPFDFEYEAIAPIPLNFVVFRGLFYAFSGVAVAPGCTDPKTTVLSLALQIMRACGIDLAESEIQSYLETEAALQHTIVGVAPEQVAEGLRSAALSVRRAYGPSSAERHSVTLELFWKQNGTDYSASQSQAATFAVEKGRQTVTLVIPPTAEPVHILRLDPFDQRGVFYIYSLRLFDSAAERVWSWDGNPASLRRTNDDLAFAEIPIGRSGVVACSVGDDPGFELPIAPELLLGIQRGGRLEVDIARPEPHEYVRLSRHVVDTQAYRDRITLLEGEKRSISAEVATRQQAYEAARQLDKEERERLSAKIAELEQDRARVEADHAELQRNFQEVGKQLSRLSAKTIQTDRVRDDFDAMNRELKEHWRSMQDQVKTLSGERDSLQKQIRIIDEMQREINQLRDSVNRLDMQFAALYQGRIWRTLVLLGSPVKALAKPFRK